MLSFISGCTGLFTDTFDAANGLEFFGFLSALILFQVCLGVFLYLYRGTKKL